MDHKCEQCEFRVGGGVSGMEMLQKHIETAHAKPKFEPKKVDRIYGDAVPDMVKTEK